MIQVGSNIESLCKKILKLRLQNKLQYQHWHGMIMVFKSSKDNVV